MTMMTMMQRMEKSETLHSVYLCPSLQPPSLYSGASRGHPSAGVYVPPLIYVEGCSTCDPAVARCSTKGGALTATHDTSRAWQLASTVLRAMMKGTGACYHGRLYSFVSTRTEWPFHDLPWDVKL